MTRGGDARTGGGAPRGVVANLQVLRALAAFLVVVFHSRILLPAWIGERLAFGNAGVDLFFFISGFIIAHVSDARDAGRPGRFLVKRAIRIVPLYWLITLALFAVAWVMPGAIGWSAPPSWAILLKSLCFIPFVNPAGNTLPILFVGWTLNYEAFFYLVFAVSLMVPGERRRLLFVSGVIGALVLAGAVFGAEGAVARTYTDALMLEFAVGVWLHVAYRAWSDAPLRGAARTGWGGVALIGLVALVWGEATVPNAPRELKWGIPAFAIVVAGLALERGGARLTAGWLQLLGEASFAIYLTHPFVVRAVAIVAERLALPAAIALPLLYALVTAVGVIFHVTIERPLIAVLRRRWLTPSKSLGIMGEGG